ncbi:hypothetical protein B484DRAFT_405670 [Ochromonadaceae sp. CCMP2298]|nr:hypothetical protein B484DRAFT_405670 [Ochromonadaceae sp. CCMP2298]
MLEGSDIRQTLPQTLPQTLHMHPCLRPHLRVASYKKELELNRKQPKPKAAKADAGVSKGVSDSAY